MTDISVIICTRNPRPEPARRVLESLRAQTLAKEEWELLIVDNGSSINKPADEWELSWHPRVRHMREDVVGVMPARLRGISDSCGELLVFVDDDTVLAPDFLSQALAISARRPDLGVFGAGTLEPEYERPPSPELLSRLHFLGIRTVDTELSCNDPNDHTCRPHGAGLCVRREVAKAFQVLADRLHVNDVVGRKGDRLFSGEDDLFSWAATAVHRGFGLFPQLHVTHLIFADRTTRDYLVRLEHDHAFSHIVLSYVLTGQKPPRHRVWKYPRLFGHALRRGTFSMRCLRAQWRGVDCALHYIEERQLRVLDEPRRLFSKVVACVGYLGCLGISDAWLP